MWPLESFLCSGGQTHTYACAGSTNWIQWIIKDKQCGYEGGKVKFLNVPDRVRGRIWFNMIKTHGIRVWNCGRIKKNYILKNENNFQKASKHESPCTRAAVLSYYKIPTVWCEGSTWKGSSWGVLWQWLEIVWMVIGGEGAASILQAEAKGSWKVATKKRHCPKQ